MACGPRTIEMQIHFDKAKQAIYKGKPFDIIDTTIDFSKQSKDLASVGVTKAGQVREVILTSGMDEKSILEGWTTYYRKQPKPHTVQEVLSLVTQYTKQLLPNSSNRALTAVEAQNKQLGNTVTINGEVHQATFITDYITNQCGVCRHHSLINAIILGSLVRDGLLPDGEVRNFRDNVGTSGHAVATYVRPNGEIWVIDSLNYNEAFQINPAFHSAKKSSKLADDFRKFVGPDFYQNLMDRLLVPKKAIGAGAAAAAANVAAIAIAQNLPAALPIADEDKDIERFLARLIKKGQMQQQPKLSPQENLYDSDDDVFKNRNRIGEIIKDDPNDNDLYDYDNEDDEIEDPELMNLLNKILAQAKNAPKDKIHITPPDSPTPKGWDSPVNVLWRHSPPGFSPVGVFGSPPATPRPIQVCLSPDMFGENQTPIASPVGLPAASPRNSVSPVAAEPVYNDNDGEGEDAELLELFLLPQFANAKKGDMSRSPSPRLSTPDSGTISPSFPSPDSPRVK